jgi:amidohydrolase
MTGKKARKSQVLKDLEGVKISRRVKSTWKEMVALRRTFHQHPELAFEEKQTAAAVANLLKKWGYEVREKIAGTGVCGYMKGIKKGKVVAVRADMDALPIQEKGDKEYKSRRRGVMHACGHDGHVAIALQVAKLVAGERGSLRGGVKFIFQPAEESPGGALPMIEEGVLGNPAVDFILALHLWNHLPVGGVGIRGGPMMASADIIKMKVTGKGGHGAAPHRTVDGILVASRIVDALQSVISRSVDPTEPSVLTVGTINGGRNFNVIAEDVEMTGTTRAFSDSVRKSFPDLIRKIAGGIARAHGARFRLDYLWNYPPLLNNYEIARIVAGEAGKVVGQSKVIDPGLQMTAEDMSYFLREVPGCFFFVGSHNPKWESEIPHHSPWFDFDERAMLVGAEVISRGIKTLTSLDCSFEPGQ